LILKLDAERRFEVVIWKKKKPVPDNRNGLQNNIWCFCL